MNEYRKQDGDERHVDQEALKKAFLEWQYLTLRKEIEISRDRHFKIAAGALVIVPAVEILAIAVKESVVGNHSIGSSLVVPLIVVLLLLPLIVLVLHAIFVSEHLAIGRCGSYIRDYIEPDVSGVVGWETWLGKTWLEQRAEALNSLAAEKGHLREGILQEFGLHPNVGLDLKEVRAHEGLQELAFRLLYASLYVIAVVSIVFVGVTVMDHWIQAVWVKVLVGLSISLLYVILWVVERTRVRRAIVQDLRALEEKRKALKP